MMFMDITVRMVLVYAMPQEAKEHAAKDITTMLSKNLLDNRVVKEYSLENSASAHNLIESGKAYGSVIIKP
jgi:NADPH2:quinone reductase